MKKNINFTLKSEVNPSFRILKAAGSCDLDISKKLTHNLSISDIDIDNDYKIGLIIGPSGSGKTTLAKHLFGDNIFKNALNEDEPIIEQFDKSYSYDECVAFLNSIGLSQVPCWIRPVKTLSNGQKARAEIALKISQKNNLFVIDEWTSVVDRNVAKIMSIALNKFLKKQNKKVVLLSCHYDIIEWLQPDWIIDCSKQSFEDKRGFLWQREKINFSIRKCDRSTWKYFSKYHYLSENLPGGKIYTFGLFDGDRQIGFQCFANYVPGKTDIYHSNRTVISPDYCGFGLGMKLIDETSHIMKTHYKKKILAKFSSIPLLKSRIKNPKWKFLKDEYNLKQGLRSGGRLKVRTFTFEYVG